MRRSLSAICLFVLIVASCREEKSAGIIPRQKMEAVLWDFIRADVYTFQYLKQDSVRDDTLENVQMQQKIFSSYKITRDEFVRSYDYYISKPELMEVMLDSIAARQSRVVQLPKPKEL